METGAPRSLQTRDVTYIALLTALMAVCAQIATPRTGLTVQFTFQTFALFVAQQLLGGRRSIWVTSSYLLLGAAGVPVFSGFQGGLGVLLGPTGGYTVGFVASSWAYWLTEKRLGNQYGSSVLGCLLGIAVCYAFGTVWFLWVYTWAKGPITLGAALGMCVFPFIVPDLLKLVIASLLVKRIKPHLR